MQVKEVAEDTLEAEFDMSGSNFDFRPGQYIRLTIHSLDRNVDRGNTRDFTIASSPHEPSTVKIIFRRSESPFKQFLMNAPKGTEVSLYGPLGVFTLPPDPMTPVVYVATGLGITPALSMIRYTRRQNLQVQMQIVWVYSKIERCPYLEEVREIANACTYIKLHEVIGPIDTRKLKELVISTDKTLWYLCGLSSMIVDISQQLPIKLDVLEENIRIEEYPGYTATGEHYKVFPPNQDVGELDNLERIIQEKNFAHALLAACNRASLIGVTDAEGTIIYANDRFVEVSKYSREELMGQNHRILKSGYHLPQVYEELWDTISQGRIWQGEVKNRAKDGSYYWVNTTIVPVFGESGNIEKYVSVRLLIGGQKELELTRKAVLNILEDFEEEKNKFEELSDRSELATSSANIGVWEWRIEQNIWLANDQFYKLFQATPEEFQPPFEGWTQFFNPSEKESAIAQFNTMRAPGNRLEMNLKAKLKNGEDKTYKVVAKSEKIEEDQSTRLIGVIRDVTRELQMEEIKTDFISLASHQLRTPLTAIKWSSEMLLKGDLGELKPEQRDAVQGLADSTNRMTALVTSLLNISRIESGKLTLDPKPTDLKKIVEDTLGVLKQDIETKKTQINLEIPGDIPQINVDPKLMIEIYQNLISNAIKYTPEGGTVTVRLSQNEKDIVTEVSDTGYGIPKDVQSRIFDRFFRAENILKHVTDGTGLGLHLTKMLVEMSGGRIEFQSEEGKGTTFRFTLLKEGSKASQGTVSLN